MLFGRAQSTADVRVLALLHQSGPLQRSQNGVAAPGVEAGLDGANPFAPVRDGFPTAGEFLAYLMTGHFAYHLGQLVAWRGAAGVGRGGGSDTIAA